MRRFIILITFFCSLIIFQSAHAANVFTYVVNSAGNSVSVIDITNNSIKTTINNIGSSPWKLVANQTGSNIYITNSTGTTVSIIDTSTNQLSTSSIAVGNQPKEIAISPDGKFLYVVNAADNNISIIDTKTNAQASGSPLIAGNAISDVAISPDGKFIYILNSGDNNVSVFDVSTKAPIMGSPVPAGKHPISIAISADSNQAFVTNVFDGTVSTIIANPSSTPPTVSNGPSINVGGLILNITLNPVSKDAYVLNAGDGIVNGTVSIIDTSKNPLVIKGSPISVGKGALGISVTPDGKTVYVSNSSDNTLSIIDVTQNPATVSSKTVGSSPTDLITINIPLAVPPIPPGDPNGSKVPPGSASGGSDKINTGATVPNNPEAGSGGCDLSFDHPPLYWSAFLSLFFIFLPQIFYKKLRKNN